MEFERFGGMSRRTLLAGGAALGAAVVLPGCSSGEKSSRWRQLTPGEVKELGTVLWQSFKGDSQADPADQSTWKTAGFIDATDKDLAQMSHLGLMFTDPGDNVHMTTLEQRSWLNRTRAGRRGIGLKIGRNATKLGAVCVAPNTGEPGYLPLKTIETVGGPGKTYDRRHLPHGLAKVHII